METTKLPAVMSLAKGWEDIERYGKAKREMLSKFLKLEQGIPKHDVYRLVFSKLSPKLVEKCFTDWVRSIKEPLENGIGREITAIDGKTVRGSFQVETGKAVHIVSAWATANRPGVRTGKDGRKEQWQQSCHNYGYTDSAGIHRAGGRAFKRHSNDRRDGLPAENSGSYSA